MKQTFEIKVAHKKPGRVQFRGLSHFSALGREILGKTERKISRVRNFLGRPGKSGVVVVVVCSSITAVKSEKRRERGICAEIDRGLWMACAASYSSSSSSFSSLLLSPRFLPSSSFSSSSSPPVPKSM